MAEVDVVEILTQLRDREDSPVGDMSALREYQVPEAWTSLYDLLDALIAQLVAVGKI